ncbi:MAG: hypothetical protein ACRCS8_00535 [Brevinema sp.]
MPGKLSEDILMIFAKKYHININQELKNELITRIRNHFPSSQKMHESLEYFIKSHPYPPATKNVKKIILPTKKITKIQPYRLITVLPQSETHIMIVWNISDQEEIPQKAWQIKNSFGLDICVTKNTRSVIIPKTFIKGFCFQLFAVHDDYKVLYAEYEAAPDSMILFDSNTYQVSSHSSDNHFRKV